MMKGGNKVTGGEFLSLFTDFYWEFRIQIEGFWRPSGFLLDHKGNILLNVWPTGVQAGPRPERSWVASYYILFHDWLTDNRLELLPLLTINGIGLARGDVEYGKSNQQQRWFLKSSILNKSTWRLVYGVKCILVVVIFLLLQSTVGSYSLKYDVSVRILCLIIRQEHYMIWLDNWIIIYSLLCDPMEIMLYPIIYLPSFSFCRKETQAIQTSLKSPSPKCITL